MKNQVKPSNYLKGYSEYLSDLLKSLDHKSIEEVAKLIIKRARLGKTVYLIGNGGSASTATHFATDLVHCGHIGHKPIIRAVSLSDNISLITAIGNDKGYEYIFANQLKALGNEGDICIVISASGNSPNLIEACEVAKKMGVTTVALLGFDGGKLVKMADHVIHVKTPKGQYGPVEDTHIFLDHMISFYIGSLLSKKNKK